MTRTNTARTIKMHLTDKEMSQADLAREMGVSKGLVNRILQYPELYLTDGQVEKIGEALGISKSRLTRVIKL